MGRTNANVVFVTLHFAAVLLAVGGLAFLWLGIPDGDKWASFGRNDASLLLCVGILGNAPAGVAGLVRKRQSIVLTVLGVLVLLPPAWAGLMICTRLW